MIRKGNIIHLLVCLWLMSLYFSIGKTAYALSSVQSLEQAMNLITLPNDFLASFVRVILDGKGQGIWLVLSLIKLVPFSSYLMIAVVALYIKEYPGKFILALSFGPIVIFIMILIILGFSLSMTDVAAAIGFAVFATKFAFALSILGVLLSIVYWFVIESESVES